MDLSYKHSCCDDTECMRRAEKSWILDDLIKKRSKKITRARWKKINFFYPLHETFSLILLSFFFFNFL